MITYDLINKCFRFHILSPIWIFPPVSYNNVNAERKGKQTEICKCCSKKCSSRQYDLINKCFRFHAAFSSQTVTLWRLSEKPWQMCLKMGDESNRKSIDPKIKFSVQTGCIDDSICMDSQQKPTFGFCLNSASLGKKATIHQVSTMLSTSRNVLFPGHNHLLTTGASLAGTRVIIKVSGHQDQWLAGGYNLEIEHFLEVDSMVVSWWIVFFLALWLIQIFHFFFCV